MSDMPRIDGVLDDQSLDAPRWEARRESLARAGLPLLLLLPGALSVYFAFNSGGMFEVTAAVGTLMVLVAILLGLAIAAEPLAALSPRGLITCGLLALLALWTLLSATWSDAPGRALIAFDRVLLYLAILVLFACVRRSVGRFRWLLRGLLFSCAGIALAGLASRLLPELWHTAPGLVSDRLSYPVTYWNTFGLLAGMGCILAVHHAADEREPASMRILGAALLPLLGVTLLLTFSRGALAVAVFGTLVYLAIARPRGLLGAALAAGPMTAIAVSQSYSAQLVHEGTPLTPAAIDQAHHLALVVVGCGVVAAGIRVLTLKLDLRLANLSLSPASRHIGRAATVAAGALIVIGFVAAGGPSSVHRQYDRFVDNTHETSVESEGQRGRLLGIGNDGRLPLWNVARDHAFASDQLKGTGAGTYELQWDRHRTENHERLYAYSLYFELLGELGLVGIVLLAGSLLGILIGLATCMRGPDRQAYAAGFAVALSWVVHAGVDIDWQTPAVCVPVFALGGLALARPRAASDRGARQSGGPKQIDRLTGLASGALRPILALACLAVALIPGQMALAQARLQDSVDALATNACTLAEAEARNSISALDSGSRPYEVLAMCAARRRSPDSAVRWAKTAVAHDPNSWEPHFVLGLAQASAGIDPRPEVLVAQRSNPRLYLPRAALAEFRDGDPAQWKVVAERLPFAMQ
jgi:O-antigen ligase